MVFHAKEMLVLSDNEAHDNNESCTQMNFLLDIN